MAPLHSVFLPRIKSDHGNGQSRISEETRDEREAYEIEPVVRCDYCIRVTNLLVIPFPLPTQPTDDGPFLAYCITTHA
jgi:hypothetical protein